MKYQLELRKENNMPDPKNALYTIRRCRKDDTPYGVSHGSMDFCYTLCGKEINHNWYIT
jgi:hypothetical protein